MVAKTWQSLEFYGNPSLSQQTAAILLTIYFFQQKFQKSSFVVAPLNSWELRRQSCHQVVATIQNYPKTNQRKNGI